MSQTEDSQNDHEGKETLYTKWDEIPGISEELLHGIYSYGFENLVLFSAEVSHILLKEKM